MTEHPNYRVAVEALVLRENKVLLVKRADNCLVAPGVWNVPAGKVKYEEIPTHAVVRECLEETGLHVRIIDETGVRTLVGRSGDEPIYRLIYTYLVESDEHIDIQLNDEHSEYAWVTLSGLHEERFSTLSSPVRDLAEKALGSYADS